MTTPTISLTTWGSESLTRGIRLTSRGRALLAASLACVLCAVAVAAVLGAALAAPTVRDTGLDAAVVVPSGSAVVYTVQPGDTLWDLAVALTPGSDPRPMVDEIQRLNGMAGSALSVGEELRLPAAR